MTNPGTPLILGLRVAAAGLATLLLSAAGLRACLHLNDLSGINHIAGIWMTLAQSLNGGVFYPPLQEDGYYAGTRYMPAVFCMIAMLARLLGNYLLAAKAVALISVIGLTAATFAVTWRTTCR